MDLGSRSDVVSGIAVAAFGLYVTVQSAHLDYVSEYGPGPGFLPLWLGIGLFTLAAYLTVSNLVRLAAEPVKKSQSWRASGRVLSGWLAVMLAIFFLPRIGFGASLAWLTIFLIIALERGSVWTAVGVGFGLAVGFYLIFIFALGLSLPAGPWGF